MSKDFSLTVQGIAVATLMLIVKAAQIDLDEGHVTQIVSTVLLIIGGLMTWYGRVRHGDITWYGRRIK